MSEYTYAWPASKLTPADMRLLHAIRESRPDHPPITLLLAQAVRAQYGHLASQPETSTQSGQESFLRLAA